MKNRFEHYWPIFNLAGIIIILWCLTAVKVNPESKYQRPLSLDTARNEIIYGALVKQAVFTNTKNPKGPYQLKKDSRTIIHF